MLQLFYFFSATMPITVEYRQVFTGPSPDHFAVVTFHNFSRHYLWGMYGDFRFGGRLTCPLQYLEDDLEPGEVRRRKLRFMTGACPILDHDVQLHAALTGRPPLPPTILERDFLLPYSFRVDLFPTEPHMVAVLGMDPSEHITVRGELTIPRGTLSTFCIHHDVQPFPY